MSERLLRADAARIFCSREAMTLVAADGSVRRLEGDTAALAEAVLDDHAAPRTRAELLAHIEALAGQAPDASMIDEIVRLLREAGALVVAPGLARPRTNARAIVAMGGAIAAADAPSVVRTLMAVGFEVRVVATERALRFVSADALEVLTHAKVCTAIVPAAGEPMRVPHVELAAWADVVIVWPASATTIARIATGDCSELVSAVAITTRAPVLIAPSMNEAMLEAPAVARNLETLRADRFHLTVSALAHEVAEAPSERRAHRGGAPDAATLTELALALVRTTARPPRDAASWEAFHRRVPEHEQPWFGDADPMVLRMLDAHARPRGSMWDVGTGHGAIAIAAADRGLRVVATDVSTTALDRARARAGDRSITWLRDDVLDTALRTDFDVVVDRGTLHTLAADRTARYVDVIAERTLAGAIVIVTAHAEDDPRVRSRATSEAEIVARFGQRFELVTAEHGPFAGALSPAPRAITVVLRRRATSR